VSVFDTICDSLEEEGFGTLDAMEEAARAIREFTASDKTETTIVTKRGTRIKLKKKGQKYEDRNYLGVNIYPADENASGMRWVALTPSGTVRADTLAGIKRLIKANTERK